jgi:hypothetical protein
VVFPDLGSSRPIGCKSIGRTNCRRFAIAADGLHGAVLGNWLQSALGDAKHAIWCGIGHKVRMTMAHLRVPCCALLAWPSLLPFITAQQSACRPCHRSARNNTARRHTGMLRFDNETFVWSLEGEEAERLGRLLQTPTFST